MIRMINALEPLISHFSLYCTHQHGKSFHYCSQICRSFHWGKAQLSLVFHLTLSSNLVCTFLLGPDNLFEVSMWSAFCVFWNPEKLRRDDKQACNPKSRSSKAIKQSSWNSALFVKICRDILEKPRKSWISYLLSMQWWSCERAERISKIVLKWP